MSSSTAEANDVCSEALLVGPEPILDLQAASTAIVTGTIMMKKILCLMRLYVCEVAIKEPRIVLWFG